MEETNLNDLENIEHLKKKIEEYQLFLTTLQQENSGDELHRLTEKIITLEHSLENLQNKFHTEIKKYEDEMANHATQVEALNQTIYHLTEQFSAVMQEKSEPNPKKESSKVQQPFAKPNDTLHIERSAESFQKNNFFQSQFAKNQSTVTNPALPDFNKPSTQKKFSVKLTTNNAASTPDREEKKVITPKKEAPKPAALTKPPEQPAQPSVPENLPKETPPITDHVKEASSLFNFFKKSK